jgi:hypothetical protein
MKRLFLIGVLFACVINLNVAKGYEEEEEDLVEVQPYAYALWWTCYSRGRIDSFYGTWTGYGPSRKHAQHSAMTQCRDIALGCRITTCHPGL